MLNIPHKVRKPFKRHFIDKVICELRFAPKAIIWDSLKANFKTISETQGLTAVREAVQAGMKFSGPPNGENKAVRVSASKIGLAAAKPDASFSVELRNDRIIFASRKYIGFDSFWGEISKMASAYAPLLKVDKFNWIGIRKFNLIGVESTDLAYRGEGLNPTYFSPLRSGFFDPSKIRVAESNYALSDGPTNCVIRAKSTRTAELKNVSVSLDIDINRALPSGSTVELLAEDAKQLNEIHFDLFVWSVEESLLAEMEKG